MEHLLDGYQGEGMFTLNKNEVEIALKDVVSISILGVVNPDFKPNTTEEPTFKDKFFLMLNKLTIRRSKNSVRQQIHKEDLIRGRGDNIFDIAFKMIVYLFILAQLSLPTFTTVPTPALELY